MSILSGFRLWLPAAFARGGYFGRNCGMDARVVVIGVVVPPAVVCLFGDLVPSSIMRKFIYKSGRTQSAQGRETCP